MNIGERIKQLRIQKHISVGEIAKELDVSKTTVYRYEDSSIEKIPVSIFDKMCRILGVTPAELMGNTPSTESTLVLPPEFKTATEAMEFLLKSPTLAAYGGYDPSGMSDETIMDFANEILAQFRLVSYKYNNRGQR